MSLRNDLRAPKTTAQKAGGMLAALALLWAAYTVCHDPYEDSLDFPDTADLAIWRLKFAVGALADSAEDSIEETNESMQDTVDGRNRLNDKRINRDVKR